MYEIHYTEAFGKAIKRTDEKFKQEIKDKLTEIAKVAKPEELSSMARFPQDILVYKKNNDYRVILQRDNIAFEEEQRSVLFVRDIILKKDFEYQWGKVIKDLKKGRWEQSGWDVEAEKELLRQFLSKKVKKEGTQRISVPHKLNDWLQGYDFGIKFNIYETGDWVSYANNFGKEGLQERNILNFKKLFIAISKNKLETTPIGQNIVYAISEDDLGIIFHKPEDGTLLIYDGADTITQKEQWKEKLQKYRSEEAPADKEEISKIAFRAYPDSVLYSKEQEDPWCLIQRAAGISNLSLLPEQVDFLENSPFPCYIDGRAGSGKSTMLYYIFANIYYRKVAGEFEGDMIFLTENEYLRKDTEVAIKSLLLSNRLFSGIPSEDIYKVKDCISSFKDFLLSLIPEELKKEFVPEKYLDFSKFKVRYNRDKPNKKNSAEELWFVISTYVYGYDTTKVIDKPDDYCAEIPSKFQLFEKDKFSEIINNGLVYYQALLAEGYWDKNTLVRRIRRIYPESLPKQYTVIFCDEAQDFSKIELKLIVESSVYLNYNLSDKGQSVPIILAGDASQTVNPTGFSERRLSEMLYIILEERGYTYKKEESTYKPKYNYRSIAPIVSIANKIQDYRGRIFGENTDPQVAKLSGTMINLILYPCEWLENEADKEEYRRKFKHKSFIVPTDLNEEEDYKSRKNLLEDFLDVKSSIAAKGAEYKQVVIFGFGDAYIEQFGELDSESPKKDFRKRFFFNKLYVAVTRAQKELTIIDSQESINIFWKKLIDNFDALIIENPQTLNDTSESTEEDARDGAINDLALGKKEENISRIRVARNIFTQLGEKEKADEAEAQISLLQGNLSRAASYFEKAGKLEDAANWYFEAKEWKALRNLRLYSNEQEARLLIANFMERGIWLEEDLKALTKTKSIFTNIITEVSWKKDWKDKVLQYGKRIAEPQEKRYFIQLLNDSVTTDVELLKLIARLQFDTREYEAAIWTWDSISEKDSNGEEVPTHVQNFYTNYIQANIELAKDNQDNLMLLKWQSIKLKQENISKSEKEILSKEICSKYKNFIDLPDVLEGAYRAAVLLKDYDMVVIVAKEFEQRELNKRTIRKVCVELHKACEDTNIKIFLEERWVKSNNIKLEDLQSLYKEEFSLETPYQWSLQDIQKISLEPQPIPVLAPKHYDFFEIENFRKFKKLTISRIGQFNLILGNNNVGKTSLLEALLFSQDSEELLKNWQTVTYWRSDNKIQNIFSDLLNRGAKKEKIIVQVGSGRRRWYEQIQRPTQEELISKFGKLPKDLVLKVGERIAIASSEPQKGLIPFVPFGKGYSGELGQHFYEIYRNKNFRKPLVQMMKLFIPDIEELIVDPSDYKIEVYEASSYEPFPLYNYGEGANKLFRILVQIFAAKGGRLMIDEIDAGVHHTKFKDFWKLILKTAKEHEVQLFVTTHNDECIRYFKEALEDLPQEYRDGARSITLEQHAKTGEIVPIVRDFKAFGYVYDLQMNLRGESYE